jgi:hypothetical protein
MLTGRPALRRARHPWMYGASARRRGRQRRGGRAAERSDSASCRTGLRRPVGVRCGLRSRQAAARPGRPLRPLPDAITLKPHLPRRPGRQQLRPAPPRDLDSPSTERRYQDEYYGSMRVKAWSGLHPKTQRIGERYGCERAPVVRGSVILVEVGKHSARPASRSTVALVLRRRGAGLGNAHRPCRGSLLSRPMLCHLRVTVPSSAASSYNSPSAKPVRHILAEDFIVAVCVGRCPFFHPLDLVRATVHSCTLKE